MPNAFSEHGGAIWDHVVSSGTLRTEDLLRAFNKELARIAPFSYRTIRSEADELLENPAAIVEDPDVAEAACEIVNDLQDAINDVASHCGFCFGASEGDGACFGYWPNEED